MNVRVEETLRTELHGFHCSTSYLKDKGENIDITVFQGDTRIDSSIEGAVGTKASEEVISHVLNGKNAYFDTDISVNGVAYYNDSKGTNPDAAVQAIHAMSRPTVLIGGGYDKGSLYDEWIEAFAGKVKFLVLIGQTREKIAACAKAHGFEDFVFAESFQEAFEICTKHAACGDAVLLSPACASWGMFPNYEERGKLFKELVYQIKERE